MAEREIRLRAAVPGDEASIAAVFDSAVLEGWRYFDDIEDMVPMFDETFWQQIVDPAHDPDLLLVAEEDDGGVVGYVGARTEQGEVWVLFVRPEAGGRGVGRRLLTAAEEHLRGAGRAEVFLWTDVRNTRARAVYEKAGYVADGQTRDDDLQGRPFTELRMVKALGSSSGETSSSGEMPSSGKP